MADTPISALPQAPNVSYNDLVPVVHSGNTVAATPSAIVASVRREGSVTVPADGTAQPITFSPPFLNTVGAIRFGLENYSGSDNAALSSPRIVNNSKSTSGFTVIVGGGQGGTTVTLHYEASGT